jgi:hypothetical protein
MKPGPYAAAQAPAHGRGMYAACSFALSQVTGITGFGAFARVWTWLAVAVSVFVFAGLIRRSWQVLSG